ALILGPSGSGKSTLLRAARRVLLERAERVVDAGALLAQAAPDGGERRVIDAVARGGSMECALGALSAAGLADAFVPARRVRELSDGQRARLGIALAIGSGAGPAATGRTTILLDELGGSLDDATARGVCATLNRWARGAPRARLLCVGAREGVLDWLAPDVLARVRDDGEAGVQA